MPSYPSGLQGIQSHLAVISFCVTLALGLDSLLYSTSQILLAYSVCLSPICLVIKVNPVFGEALYINPKSVCVFAGVGGTGLGFYPFEYIVCRAVEVRVKSVYWVCRSAGLWTNCLHVTAV